MVRFAIVGSGWRSLFYVRVAKALPETFELAGLLCRSEEKAERLAKEYEIPTFYHEEDVIALKPDFIVSAVNKAGMYDNCRHWLDLGFPVLSETPVSLEVNVLDEVWKGCQAGDKLQVAEQYCHYPYYQALIDVVKSGLIGEPVSASVSCMHDYHAASLIREILGIGLENVSITGKTFTFPVTETKTRYEELTTGAVVLKEQTHLVLEYESGKTAFYDFMSEQYRSTIRKPFINIRGARGEITGNEVYYLNEENRPCTKTIVVKEPYQQLGLGQDETAIASMLIGMKAYADGGEEVYPMCNALEDAYIAVLMKEAGSNPYQTVKAGDRVWKQ